ncbi:hypothetical protein FS749_009953 [Ceratobasidium sp. UAMH 11750]|nr:hypothetical protein FS749_009953 [Ceratobasidium sp. UAMH 11750]
MILDQTMDRLQHALNLAKPPSVREHFDIVAGTGTGAVIACMVGRLGIPVKDAIDHYVKLAAVFSDRKLIGTATFKASKLQEVLKGIIRDAVGDENVRMMDTSVDGERCRTMVFAMSRHNMNAGIPRIFRSYQVVANQMPDCAIWEALHASMAHPELFKPIDIGEAHLKESFVDGGLGCTNPTTHVLAEAKALFPGRHVSTVVCIGAGHPDTIAISDTSSFMRFMPANVLAVTKQIAADGERVAQEIAARFQAIADVYFRFSVDQGMQSVGLSEWERLSAVSAHTRTYMQMANTHERMNRAVQAIRERRATISAEQIDGQIQPPSTSQTTGAKSCPPPTPVFTGRRDKIEQIKACISCGDQQRCVFVLHGLGGAGKTQLALKTVEETQDMWADILFVDATSRETATSALEAYGKDLKVGQTERDTIRWLENRRERWLMVFDNADDPSVRITDLFPGGNHGSILVTTRIPGMAVLAQGPSSDFGVSSMEPGDALELLLKTAGMREIVLEEAECNAANELLESFGHLALAIVQAGAYIRCSQRTIYQYRDMFVKHRKATLERYDEVLVKVDNYQKSVYTTWHMSYQLLSARSQRLLHLVAFMHHNDITEDIFRRAAVNLPEYKPAIPATDEETSIKVYVMEFLELYLDSTGAWDSGAFLTTMTELTSYSLMSYNRANGTYTMHVLVHDWASTVTNHSLEVAVEHTALLLAVSIDYEDTMESLAYIRGVEVHVNRILERQPRPSANNCVLFAEVYYHARKWKQNQELEEIALAGRRQALGDEHDSTLTSIHNLALAYREQGGYKRAEEMLSQVAASRKRLAGEEHPRTLDSMYELAYTYYLLGRYEEARSLQAQIADTRKRTLGEDDPDTLRSMRGLAITFIAQGRYHQAEGVLVQVVEGWKRQRGEEHPDTLSSMYDLAHTFQEQGRHDQAEALLVQVLATRKQVSGEEHPETLTTMHALASTYYYQRRYEQAELLQAQVVKARMCVSGGEHPDTLSSMSDLALTYCDQGRYEQAEALQVQVLDADMRVYGEDHPETLTTMLNLAYTYWRQGRYEKAEELGVQVVDTRKQVLGLRHPHTLLAMHNLAGTYQSLGERRRTRYGELQAEIHRLEVPSE